MYGVLRAEYRHASALFRDEVISFSITEMGKGYMRKTGYRRNVNRGKSTFSSVKKESIIPSL